MNFSYLLEEIKYLAKQIIEIVNCLNVAEKEKPIEELGLSNRALKCLAREDIKTVKQLMQMNKEQLIRLRGVGKRTLNEVLEKINDFSQ